MNDIDNVNVAVKQPTSASNHLNFARELELYRILNQPGHRNIASLKYELEPGPGFALEYCSLRSIQHSIIDPNLTLTLDQVRGATIADAYERRTICLLFYEEKDTNSLFSIQYVCILIEILEGIEYLCSKRVVNCDIKPHNILFTYDGTVKIVDFGIGYSVDWAVHTSTEAGTAAFKMPADPNDATWSSVWTLGTSDQVSAAASFIAMISMLFFTFTMRTNNFYFFNTILQRNLPLHLSLGR